MIWNILLVLALFTIPRKKLNPYAAAGILGAVKAALYLYYARDVVLALIMGGIFFGLAACFMFFLQRLDQNEKPDEIRIVDGIPRKKTQVRWEYIPIAASVLLLVFGEMGLSILLSSR